MTAQFARPTRAIIDLKAITHNYHELKKMSGHGSFFCPMVKANAYGHGDIEVARALVQTGCTRLGVCLVEEGVRLRQAGITCEILVFNIFFEIGCKEIVEHRLTPVLSSWDEIRILESRVSFSGNFPVHLKFNTGMNRLGFAVEDAPKLASHFTNKKNLRIVGLCTHLANGEDAGQSGFTDEQLAAFSGALDYFKPFSDVQIHALNSSGLFGLFENGKSIPVGARPGLSLYGVQPPNSHTKVLKPAMSVISEIVMTQKVSKGQRVSYSGTWTAERDSLIGIVPIGYADGLHRRFSNRGTFLCKGKPVPIRGIVCMDYTLVDLTDLAASDPSQLLRQEVLIFGSSNQGQIHVNDMSRLIETIPYEIMTSVSMRVPRFYI